MKQKMKLVVTIALSLAIALVTNSCIFQPKKPPQDITLADLANMQQKPDKNDISTLIEVIKSHSDDEVREEAVFVLTDTALETGTEVDKVIDFLKGVATGDENEAVATAAFANIDLARKTYPLESKGSLRLSVLGNIARGNTVTLMAEVGSSSNVEDAIVGIIALHPNIQLLSQKSSIRLPLKAGQFNYVSFPLQLKETGEYLIRVGLKLNFDQVDYEFIDKSIYLKVGETSGEASERQKGTKGIKKEAGSTSP